MRLVVAGGGTGGHLFPGLAVADALMERGGSAICFVGSASGIEARLIPQTRYPFVPLLITGLRGRGLRGLLGFPLQLPRAIWTAWSTLGQFRPSLVIGLGGYGSAPVVVAAWLRRVPSILLEQNARPGMANRCLAYLARRVCTTFAESARWFPAGKAVHTGNPVRRLISSEQPRLGHFTVFAFGGSQGARSINRAMVEAAAQLMPNLPGLQIIHQTGAADVEWVTERYHATGIRADVSAFIQDMGDAYGRADIVVCRAGATTIAELTSLGKPSILVPYPYAADDHQRANAEVLVNNSAAEMLLDADLSGESLAARLLALAHDAQRRRQMSAAARAMAVEDAAARVLAVCCDIAGRNQ